MKKFLFIIIITLAVSCGSNKSESPDPISGTWICVKEWSIAEEKKFKPSESYIVMVLEPGGTLLYTDKDYEPFKTINTWDMQDGKLRLSFEGNVVTKNALYEITKLDKDFLFINTTPSVADKTESINYIFIKKGSPVESLYENTPGI